MRYRAFPDCARFPLGDNVELVYTPLTRTARTLSPVAAAILFRCGRFATLEEHAARVCRDNNLRPEQQPTVLAQLTAWRTRGSSSRNRTWSGTVALQDQRLCRPRPSPRSAYRRATGPNLSPAVSKAISKAEGATAG